MWPRRPAQLMQEFEAKKPLLEEAFPLVLQPTTTPNGYQIQWDISISNVHEAEIMLRSLGCNDRGIQHAMARFLSASAPEYGTKTLVVDIGTSDDQESLGLMLQNLNPAVGVNNFQAVNVDLKLNLKDLMKSQAVDVLEKVLFMVTLSDKWLTEVAI
jgi:hypothetical protein